MFQTFLQDARYAARLLRKSPLFTATAAVSLAIGIGANTTIFSIANALLLRPLPGLAEPERLVDIGRTQRGTGFDTVSFPNYQDVRHRATLLQGVYAYAMEPQPMSLGGGAEAERIYATVVSANYFTVLGTQPAAGRLLRDDDDQARGELVAVISSELHARRYASDPAAVGQTITINGAPFTIVGVAPPGFQGTTVLKADLWAPVSTLTHALPRLSADLLTNRAAQWLVLGGRLAPGVSFDQANAELLAIGAALEREFPDANRGKSYRASPSAVVPGRMTAIAGFLGLLSVIVGLVLLIACINVAGMLLARAASRRREIAVRLAIGAGRGRLIRQLLTETVILVAIAGCAGLLVTNWLTALLLAVLPELPVPVQVQFGADWRVAVFAVVLSLATAVAAGLAPALQASRADLAESLKADGLVGSSPRLRLRSAFVIGQVAMSLVLIIAAGLFLRALQHAASVDPGFDQANVDVVSLDLSLAGYQRGTAEPFVRELVSRVRALPRVEAATIAIDLPLDGGRFGLGGITVPGVQPPPGLEFFPADWNVVEPGFFETLKLPLVRGRDFTAADDANAPRVAIVNEALARRLWPGLDAVGRQFQVDNPVQRQVVMTVVGVARDARLISLNGSAAPYVYVPYAQQHMSRVSLLVRTAGPSAIPQVRGIVRAMNPNLPVSNALPLEQVTAFGLVPQRVAAAVAGSLGIVGLLLAAIGIYGVTSYAVSRRTREIGIRMALGADGGNVRRLILRQGTLLTAIGMGIGLVLGGIGAKLLESLLFGVGAFDPVTFGGACALFALISAGASYLPARRATRVNPIAALRAE